ncbi:MAG TPA: hypothetical protein VGI32_15185 [Steroidobacteraceae bacterium]|jgi:hypothetical protein
MESSLLAGWDNFYVIAGGAAGGLTGLTFVVISLAADAHRVSQVAVRAFVTPTIVHFGSVLALAAYVTMPRHTIVSLSLGLGVVGLAGLVYIGTIAAAIHRVRGDYTPVLEDWLWNVIFPALCFCILLATAILFSIMPKQCPYSLAAAIVLLMIVGIHNAWDIAVWNSIKKNDETPPSGS